jgi:hypothetical protein
VCSSATATDQTHFEAMAFARRCIDRFIGDGPLPTGMTDRLQCTALGHPMKIVEPTAAAHAAVTPFTLQARLHTVPMIRWTAASGTRPRRLPDNFTTIGRLAKLR